MNVLLLQIDGKVPNLALMRLAGHHRFLGDSVTLRQVKDREDELPRLGDCFDRVYGSMIFEYSRAIGERIISHWPGAILGGTGWDLSVTLEKYNITALPDYSIYPNERRSIGFTQRGCRLNCSFCVVPRKEGKVRQEATVRDIWRGDPWPKQLLLLDNDFFGQLTWRERIREIRDGGFRVSFNQGINARMISDEAAEAIASVDYRDDSMKTKRIYTAWDSRKDEDVLFRGLNRLVRYGVKPDHIMVYMLIAYWPDETEEDWLYRYQRLHGFGARPYPMPFVRTPLTVGFQRWVIGSYHRRISWREWKTNNCRPEHLFERQGRTPLPLFDNQENA